eukprot:scaffold1157_cov122-Cylindrotheca_fusiformis.AAC.3
MSHAPLELKYKYEILEVIGTGAYGTVRKCRNRQTNELAAIKTINKSKVRQVEHPNIIRLYDIYEDVRCIHLVTELCTGGELYDRVIEKAESEEGHYSEADAASLIQDILGAIAYCHDVVNIVHRDLKPENFLLLHQGDDAPIKIIDFGLSRFDDSPSGIMKTRVGSPYYVAPEVLNGAYTNKCDIWSVGVIAYLLLCGFPPFNGDSDGEILFTIKNANLSFPSPEWDDISPMAKDFVMALLDRDPSKRLSASEALKHPWISEYANMGAAMEEEEEEMKEDTFDPTPSLPQPRPFTYAGRPSSSVKLRMQNQRKAAFQKLLAKIKVSKAIHGTTDDLTDEETYALGELFKRVDKDRNGIIRMDDIDEAADSGKPMYATTVPGR